MGKRSRKQRQEVLCSQSNSSVLDSSLLDRSSKKQRTQQAVSTPLTHKDILSQFEFVRKSISVADEMDSSGGNNIVDFSADSARVISPKDTFLPCLVAVNPA